MSITIKNLLQKAGIARPEVNAMEAYEIWSDSYDNQPGNLMLDLDELIFSSLVANIDLDNKRVADVGCGTGRHWQKIYDKNPALVMGFDISAGMLHQLMRKFPFAFTQKTTDNLLASVPDASVDFLISTLTIAHIRNIEEAIASWSRVLEKKGELIVTDFHPSMLEKGGKRSFSHDGRIMTVKNYIHPLEEIKKTFIKHGFYIVREEERKVNEEVRSYYESRNALPVYERFRDMPIIYGLHLKKQDAA